MENNSRPTVGDHCHFTYCVPTRPYLQQGDILRKSEEICKILESVHPHYLKEDYTHFIILTQSCDLVIRDGVESCKARYLSLAAVRPLDLVLERELERYQNPFAKAAGVCKEGTKIKLMNFLESLLNNNNSEYFYLHEQPELGFPENSCAFLRLSVAIRSDNHYSTCVRSRILSLQDNFQAKLGWLVGNMYSRVGTDDWVPTMKTQEEFTSMINEILEVSCMWVNDKQLEKARKEFTGDITNSAQDDLRRFIKKTSIPSKRELILKSVIMCLKDMEIVNREEEVENVYKLLMNDPSLSSIIK